MTQLLGGLLALLAASVIGCGGADEEERVADTIESYIRAIGRGDGAAACEQLTRENQRQVAASTSEMTRPRRRLTCAQAAAAFRTLFDDPGLEAVDVEVDGDNATGVIRSPEGESEEARRLKRYTLVKVDGEWRIADQEG